MPVPTGDGAQKSRLSGPARMCERWSSDRNSKAQRAISPRPADPFALFSAWMAEAEASEPADPEAMAVATVDADGLPNVRMIFLKGADARGFVFYTNCESAKGNELAANPQGGAAVLLEEPGAADSPARADRAGDARRSRRLFRHPPSREPHRRVRLAPVAAARLARGARG